MKNYLFLLLKRSSFLALRSPKWFRPFSECKWWHFSSLPFRHISSPRRHLFNQLHRKIVRKILNKLVGTRDHIFIRHFAYSKTSYHFILTYKLFLCISVLNSRLYSKQYSSRLYSNKYSYHFLLTFKVIFLCISSKIELVFFQYRFWTLQVARKSLLLETSNKNVRFLVNSWFFFHRFNTKLTYFLQFARVYTFFSFKLRHLKSRKSFYCIWWR